MGSTDSRSRLRKVAPFHSPQEEGKQEVTLSKPEWTVPALPVTAELQSGSLGQRNTTVPPLKQTTTPPSLSGRGQQRWGCPAVFYNRADRTLRHQQNDSAGDPNNEGTQRLKPVRRLTERDVFRDEIR